MVESNVYSGVNNPLQVASGVMRATGNLFQNASGANNDDTAFTPPYDYDLDATSGLEAAIKSAVGPK